MKRIVPTIFLLLLILNQLWATHNRAGEITLKQLDEFTYEILITTFTYTLSQADRSSLEVQWGDNTISTAPRISIEKLPGNYQKNIYTTRHTFPGSGTYEIIVQDPNRNLGVKNIPNSVNVVFSIKTTIAINPAIGTNSTPVLLSDPIDRAALNQVFIHNPSAYDPDGDSISYKLTVCTEEDGNPIEGYELPYATDTLYIDPYTGDLFWITPDETGIYNIAIDIEEWREGVKIGNIVRDMQIEVFETDNNKPYIDSLYDYCVEAGTLIEFNVVARDYDLDSVYLNATGGPFEVQNNPAFFDSFSPDADFGFNEGFFKWETNCSHVREQDYTVVFKAEDNNPETQLVDLKNVRIKVIGSPPDTPELTPASNSITLNWDPDPCPYVTGYRIFRREGPSGYTPDSCVTGVPSYTDYRPITDIKRRSQTRFVDDGRGQGLNQGTEFCYMIASIYPDGALSLPSGEACSPLVAGLPALLQVSVTEDTGDGEIDVRWAMPEDLDTIPANGPYQYVISRSQGLYRKESDKVFLKNTTNISDTIFTDSNIYSEIDSNTVDTYRGYSYTIALYNNEPGNKFPISDTSRLERASSFYPDLVGEDNQIKMTMRKNVPWINYDYTIYRLNNSVGAFDSIGYTTAPVYTDTGLKNGVEYCYRIKSTGWRIIEGDLFENVNYSHINCTRPIDTIRPCTPYLQGQSFCDEFYNQLNWGFLSDSCLGDVEGYELYYNYTPNREDRIDSLIFKTDDKTETSYIDIKTNASLTGCYYIIALDSMQNRSKESVQLCLDECSNYVLPNVFSPNDDNTNDLYIPLKTAYVEKVDFQLFNRWGLLVFQTNDPGIQWDGKIMGTDQLVAPGVYYYICEVFEPRLSGLESYTLTGFIYVFSGDKNDGFIEK
ncbi:MAG: gliding motility-associated C-terminal domain-containing protein [Bacteroidales bacterium]|nr:gliding motility-associated C-terminal domain-containing protein [Bacteroidales bacterium]